MITIQKSCTADTRSCDPSKVTKEELLRASKQHIGDVLEAMNFFANKLREAGQIHDWTKLQGIDEFYKDFSSGFKTTGWWEGHRLMERHHIAHPDGVKPDINLIDVLEYIADCTMAGMARTGTVFKLEIPDEVLRKAFENTCELMKKNVEVTDAP